jgi:hypothetical protein
MPSNITTLYLETATCFGRLRQLPGHQHNISKHNLQYIYIYTFNIFFHSVESHNCVRWYISHLFWNFPQTQRDVLQ